MKALYERLADVLVSIEPRNERARAWLDRLVLHCHAGCKANGELSIHRATVGAIRFDFQPLLIIQGRDEAQRPLYQRVEALLNEMEHALETRSVNATGK